VIEYAIFLHWLARQWRPQKNKIWHKGSLGDEDDARTLNICIAQRKRTIPHLMMKNSNRNIIQCCNHTHQDAMCLQTNVRLCFRPRWRPVTLLVICYVTCYLPANGSVSHTFHSLLAII